MGKTIEAGLVLAELRLRGLAARTLVVAPAGLVTQWQEELERKFGLPTVTAGRDGWVGDRLDQPVVLASLTAARRDPLKSALVGQEWDAVIVDEAHRVRAPRSASGKLVRELRTRYLMLLTATPVENRLQDLYEMVSLVAPGLLGTAAEFRTRHGGGSGGRPRDIEALRARTREVMVRHRRSEVALMLPQRLAETLLVSPSADEAQWYADLTARIRREARTGSSSLRLTMRTLTRLAGSGPTAAGPTLTKIGWSDLADRARRIHRSQKDMIEQRLGRLHRIGQQHDVLVSNLVARGTIEEHILRVLESKINLFELVVGELDLILGRVDDDFDLESTIFDTFVEADDDDDEFTERLESLGDDLARARTDYLHSRDTLDALVGEETAR